MGLNLTMRARGLIKIKKAYAGHFVYQWIKPADLNQKKLDGWEEA
jgi:hypothetical protein